MRLFRIRVLHTTEDKNKNIIVIKDTIQNIQNFEFYHPTIIFNRRSNGVLNDVQSGMFVNFLLFYDGKQQIEFIYKQLFTLYFILTEYKNTSTTENVYIEKINKLITTEDFVRIGKDKNPILIEKNKIKELMGYIEQYQQMADDKFSKLISFEDFQHFLKKNQDTIAKVSIGSLFLVIVSAGLVKYWPLIKSKAAAIKQSFSFKKSIPEDKQAKEQDKLVAQHTRTKNTRGKKTK
jgi:hypothetical protein